VAALLALAPVAASEELAVGLAEQVAAWVEQAAELVASQAALVAPVVVSPAAAQAYAAAFPTVEPEVPVEASLAAAWVVAESEWCPAESVVLAVLLVASPAAVSELAAVSLAAALEFQAAGASGKARLMESDGGHLVTWWRQRCTRRSRHLAR
jgi:hypothetical protein